MKHKKRFIFLLSVATLAAVAILGFLNLSSKTAKSTGGCSGIGCSGCSACSNAKRTFGMYYTAKENKLLKALKKNEDVFSNALSTLHTKNEIETIKKETTEEFIKLIPQIPYIGGDDNSMTEDIEQAAMVLAFYRVEKQHGKTADDVGSIIYDAIESEMSKYPKWLMRLSGSKFFSDDYIEKVRKDAAESQKGQYPGAWVTTFIEGDGKEFDYGFNHTECGIVKFFHEQDADELTPYLCKLDFLYSEMMDEGLVRTSTLAEGSKFCDFRYKRVQNKKLRFQ